MNLRDLFADLLFSIISFIAFASFILVVIYGLISVTVFIGFVLRLMRSLFFIAIRHKRPPLESPPDMAKTEPGRIRSFQFYLFAPKTRGWRRRRLMFLAAFVFLAVYIVAGIFPDRSFELSKLRGLTPAQIVAKFGKPEFKTTDGEGRLW
ncbi:MAG TPA: hypothetical protein VMG59_12740, partial [Phycisphaerae bacterium]|nr:hypothetical protein [Phycisphaerae bacterium]